MTKRKLIELDKVLTHLSAFGKTKFKYTILKNIEVIKSDINILSEVYGSIKKLLSPFEEERNNLILKLGKTKEDGSVFIDTTDKEMLDAFNKELSELLVAHSEELHSYNIKIKEYEEILNEELNTTFNFIDISIDELPDDGLSIEQLSILESFNLIKE